MVERCEKGEKCVLRAVPGAGLAAPRRDRDVEAIVNPLSVAPIFGERQARAAGPEATEALSEARAWR